MAALTFANFSGTRLIAAALAVSTLGWLGLAAGFNLDPSSSYFAYLTAFSFATSIALGALVFLMTSYIVNAKWSVAVRRLNESIVSVLPLLGLLFLPVAFGLGELYLWAAPEPSLPEHELHALEHRKAYLNQTFFLVRTGAYFVLWGGCAAFLNRRSALRDRAREEPPRDPSEAHARERSFSAGLLPFVALALSFASFDWLMSLQPFWSSSIFGVYYFAGGLVAALGLLSVLAFVASRSGAANAILPAHFHALGRLMFGFTVFWAYTAFFQALLISLPNRPEEVVFYARRLEGGWYAATELLVIVRFVVPFVFLLPRRIKFSGAAMAAAGAWLILGHYLDMYWLVAPIHSQAGPSFGIWDLTALCAVAAPSVAFGAWWLHGKPAVPAGDPKLSASIAYRSPS